MSKASGISGFPEWLPEQKLAEQRAIEKIRAIYESFGFVPIETPAVELLSTLAAKGVVNKEIFGVKRVHAEGETEAELALHFDLTVPFARYVAQHFSELTFPFKRYQLQKVWRGDRPQKGRFREFYQFDVDMIAREDLPLSADAEILTVLDRAYCAMALGEHRIKFNNRKVLIGLYRALSLDEAQQRATITVVDKLDKIGAQKVHEELCTAVGLSSSLADKVVSYTGLAASGNDAAAMLSKLDIDDALFQEGKGEILEVVRLLPEATRARVRVDLSLARGLDYYTGTIFEFQYPSYPEFGTVGSGGRYQDLASEFINKKLPGVGGSIGLTRLMSLAFTNNLIAATQKTAAPLLLTVLSEEARPQVLALADTIRERGIGVEVFFKSPKLGKQIEYAESKGMRYVGFLANDGVFEVKDLVTKEQRVVGNLDAWCKEIH